MVPLVARDLWSQPFAHDVGDLARFGVSAERGFREDQVTVERDFEAALRRRDHVDVLDDRSPPGEEFVRQTDGTRYVVSGDAEFDGEPVSGIEHVQFLSARTSSTASHTQNPLPSGRP